MSGGRPRTAIGTYGAVYVMPRVDRCVAETRFRDLDGRLRKVTATASSPSAAKALLKERLLDRVGYGSGGQLSLSSSFGDLVALWLVDLDLRELTAGTKESYRDQVRLHVLPAFEHFTLGEITTGRVEWFLKSQAADSSSRAQRSRTMLNLLFGFALRHDAISRNPVEGTSSLRGPEEPAAGPHAGADCGHPRGRGQLPHRDGSAGAQARRPGARHHRGPAWDGHASRRGTGAATVRRRGLPARDDRRGDRHRGAAQGQWRCPSGPAEVGCVDPSDPGAGVRRCGAPATACGCSAGSDNLREPERWTAQPVQRTAHVQGVPRGRPGSRTRGSACAGTGARERP